jgi:hypothetical protein
MEMGVENIILREVSQAQKAKNVGHTLRGECTQEK